MPEDERAVPEPTGPPARRWPSRLARTVALGLAAQLSTAATPTRIGTPGDVHEGPEALASVLLRSPPGNGGDRRSEQIAAESKIPAGAAEGELPGQETSRWFGPEGERLPFRTDGEVLAFLATAEVVASERIPDGINRPLRLVLEQQGLRVRAIFRTVNKRVKDETRRDRRGGRKFRDSYLFECAAFELDRLLGLGRVPPVVERRIRGRSGSLQIWVENAFDEETRRRDELEPPDRGRWRYEQSVKWIFDSLINNRDRNQGNQLFDRQWKLWLIDHTRAFAPGHGLLHGERITRCDRRLFESLRTLDRELVERKLAVYLTRAELRSLLARRDKLVELIRSEIEERGESSVLTEPPGGQDGSGRAQQGTAGNVRLD